MKIQCENQSCKEDIYIEENITCPNCKQIQKKKLTIKNLFIGTFFTLIAGGYSGYIVSNITHHSERYPINTEFSIVNYCINGDNTFHNIEDLKVKKDICIHAYYKTIQEVNYDDFRANNNTFTKLFRKNIDKSLLLNEIIRN